MRRAGRQAAACKMIAKSPPMSSDR